MEIPQLPVFLVSLLPRNTGDSAPTQYACILLWPCLEYLMEENGLSYINVPGGVPSNSPTICVQKFQFKRDTRVYPSLEWKAVTFDVFWFKIGRQSQSRPKTQKVMYQLYNIKKHVRRHNNLHTLDCSHVCDHIY